MGAPNANDPAASVFGGNSEQFQLPNAVSQAAGGTCIANTRLGGGPINIPNWYVVSGVVVALTAGQVVSHLHKLMPADATATAFFATLGTINVGAANQI